MSVLNYFFGFVKKVSIFILIVAIVIPLRYGLIDHQYLRLRVLHSMLSLKYTIISDEGRPNLSADYRAFEDIIRMKPIIKFDARSEIPILIKEFRSNFAVEKFIPKPSECQVSGEQFDYDGHSVDGKWIDYHGHTFERTSDPILVYLHGGGYMLGDIQTYIGFECHLSRLLNVTVLHLEYRRCPEHSLSAAVQDSVVLYQALLRDKISSSQLVLMGDSAGGGLALLTIQALLEQRLPVPRGVIVLSPWTDLSASGESQIRNRDADVFFRNIKQAEGNVVAQMLGLNLVQLSADNPPFSPLFGSFVGFPPMYINVGTAETLEDDSRRLLKKAQEAGVDVMFEEGLHLMHIYPVFFPYYPEARTTLDNINQWFRKIVANKLAQ